MLSGIRVNIKFLFSYQVLPRGQEPFHLEDAAKALDGQGLYISACNLMWIDLFRTSNPSVPLCRKRVEDLASHYFSSGHSFFRSVLEVAVVKEELSDRPAGLKLISPEEQAHSIVFACAKRLKESDCKEDERKQWRLTLQLGQFFLIFLRPPYKELELKFYWIFHSLFNLQQVGHSNLHGPVR